MAVLQMQKVAIVAPRSLKEPLLIELQNEGVLEVTDVTQKQNIDHTEVAVRAAELEFAINVLKDHASKATHKEVNRLVSEEEIMKAAHSADLRTVIDELHTLEQSDTDLSRKEDEYVIEMTTLKPWLAYPYPLQQSAESQVIVEKFGILPRKNSDVLRSSVEQKIPKSVMQFFPIDETVVLMSVALWKEDLRTFEEKATTLGWSLLSMPSVHGIAKDVMATLAKNLQEINRLKAENTARRKELSVSLPGLARTRMYMRWLDSRQSVRESALEGSATITLMGWVAKKNAAILQVTLAENIAPSVQIFRIKPEKGEEVPVLIQNAKIITPFESVTTLYGFPLSTENDPTLALSPFFVLFFGLCLTDAGYGLVLALMFGIYLFVSKKTIDEAKLPWLLFISGLVTIVVSIPFGGWFGLTPEQVPAVLTYQGPEGRLFLGQIWNLSTQSGIEFLQNLSLVLGIVHIFFGIFLAGWHKLIHGAWAEAFWTAFSAHLLLITSILYIVKPGTIVQTAFFISLALFVWGKGMGSAWYIRPLMGTLGTVNFSISLLSNSLSYLRLLALGLVTGAIALAVNQVALEMSKLFPLWLGIPVMIVILILGHLVSIALNVLGSFIHSGRLQFIEFFSQFFEGGGRPFSPFSRSKF